MYTHACAVLFPGRFGQASTSCVHPARDGAVPGAPEPEKGEDGSDLVGQDVRGWVERGMDGATGQATGGSPARWRVAPRRIPVHARVRHRSRLCRGGGASGCAVPSSDGHGPFPCRGCSRPAAADRPGRPVVAVAPPEGVAGPGVKGMAAGARRRRSHCREQGAVACRRWSTGSASPTTKREAVRRSFVFTEGRG